VSSGAAVIRAIAVCLISSGAVNRFKTILIVGGSGYLGTHLCLKLRDNYKVFATYHKNPTQIQGVTFFPLDALKRDFAKRLMYSIRPEIIIYVAGSNDVAWAEKNPRDADRIHTGGTVNISTVSEIFQPKLIYLSNAYVFDGKRGNYHEIDVVLPEAALGKSKLSSENFIKSKSLNFCILRSSPIFGRGTVRHPTLLDQLRIALAKKQRIELSHDAYHSWIPMPHFLQAVEGLIENPQRNKVYHLGGLTRATAFDLGREFAREYGYSPDLIQPLGARTPELDFSLNSSQLLKQIGMRTQELTESLHLLRKEMDQIR
jgi:dTDP-4-dehydrorhamnose reductase